MSMCTRLHAQGLRSKGSAAASPNPQKAKWPLDGFSCACMYGTRPHVSNMCRNKSGVKPAPAVSMFCELSGFNSFITKCVDRPLKRQKFLALKVGKLGLGPIFEKISPVRRTLVEINSLRRKVCHLFGF